MSDPSVAQMTYAQWMFEALALKKREADEAEVTSSLISAFSRILRETLIGVLGLGLVKPKPDAKPEDGTAFVPASFIMGRPEMLKHFLEDMKKEEKTEDALNDEAFEAFSAKLAKGDVGDMDPLIVGHSGPVDPGAFWASAGAKQMLASMGIKQRTTGRAAPHMEGKPRVMFDDEENVDG